MFDNLRHDTRRMREIKTKPFPGYVIESLLFENGYQAVVLHRIAHAFKRRRIPFLGPFFHRLSIFLTGVDIAPAAEVGPGFRISHGVGIVIGNGVRIGPGCMLMQCVTLGAPTQARIDEMPQLGENVTIGAGAAVIGKVKIGSNVLIALGSVVTTDVGDDCKVAPSMELRIVPRTRREGETGG
jgi:serine O-acetyltransferase